MQTQTVVLNVAPGGVPPIVYATQNDNGRTIHISVIDGASGYSLSDSYTYVICGTKPSGTGFSYDDKVTKIGSSMLSFDVNTVMTAVAGPVRCGIIIYDGDQHVETLAFILQVQESALSPETIIDSNDFQSIIESAVRDYIEEAGLVVDDQLETPGAAADAKKTGDEINALKSAIEQGTGLTDEAKEAILDCFAHVAWIDEHGQDYYNALEEALYNTTWAITNNLTNCTTSNEATSVTKGGSYSATITASAGYVMTGATVSITMGGVDVTASVYSNGVISIPAVTGALEISITAAALEVSSISATFTQGAHSVFETDELDTLKPYLVVTATFTDSSTATLDSSDYTLSGTLEEGTSTITATYDTETATFTVSVVALPTGYTAYDYITFSGSQYAYSGVYESAALYSAEYKYMRSATTNPNYHVLSSTNVYYYYASTDNGNKEWKQKFNGSETSGFQFPWSTNTDYKVVVDMDGGNVYINGDLKKSGIVKGSTYSASNQFVLGAYGGSVSTAKYRLIGRIYYIKLYNSSGVAHYYKPAVRTSDSAVGFYDLVTNTFITSGSGTAFTGGNLS